MFLLNSRMGHFTAPPGIAPEDPFSRSYGAMLPSSLTRFLSRALVCLHPPTCVGLRYGRQVGGAGAFLGSADARTWKAEAFLGAAVPRRAGGRPSPPLRCPSPTPVL